MSKAPATAKKAPAKKAAPAKPAWLAMPEPAPAPADQAAAPVQASAPAPAPAPGPRSIQMQSRTDELVVIRGANSRAGARKLVIVIPPELDALLRARVVGSHSTAIAALAQYALESTAKGLDITLS